MQIISGPLAPAGATLQLLSPRFFVLNSTYCLRFSFKLQSALPSDKQSPGAFSVILLNSAGNEQHVIWRQNSPRGDHIDEARVLLFLSNPNSIYQLDFRVTVGNVIGSRFLLDNIRLTSDEGDCRPPSCLPGQFDCGDSTCRPGAAWCNGKIDCGTGADEPVSCFRKPCPPGWFLCNETQTHQCIDGKQVLQQEFHRNFFIESSLSK